MLIRNSCLFFQIKFYLFKSMTLPQGLCRLYQYYEGMVQVDPETDQIKRQEDSFVNPMNTFRTLFWAIFCMSSMDAPAVIIENMNDTECHVNYINRHYFTEFTGYFLFAGQFCDRSHGQSHLK